MLQKVVMISCECVCVQFTTPNGTFAGKKEKQTISVRFFNENKIHLGSLVIKW